MTAGLLLLAAKVMALVEVPQFGPPSSPPSALELEVARREAAELGKVMGLVRKGAEAVLLTQSCQVGTEGRPKGGGSYPGDILVRAEEGALKKAGLEFAQAAFGKVGALGILLRAPKVLLILDTRGCFERYRDLVHAREALEEVLRLLGVDYKVYVPPGGPTGLAPLPEGILRDVNVVIDAAEIVGWGWDEGAKRALREFLDRGGALVAVEAGCYRYVTKPGRGEEAVPKGGSMGLVDAEAILGGCGPRSGAIRAGSPLLIRVPAVAVGGRADEFRRTGLKPLGPGAVVLASDPAGTAQVLLSGRVLLIGPRVISHAHDGDLSGVSDLDRAYNFYNGRLLFNALALFCGRTGKVALSGPRWSFRPRWAALWEQAKEEMSEALAALGLREQELEGVREKAGAFAPVGYLLALLKTKWGLAREASLELAAGRPEEAARKAAEVMKAVREARLRLDWFVADEGEYGSLLVQFFKALTDSVERGIPVDRFTRACALADSAVSFAKGGGMQQAAELLKRALKVLRGKGG